MQQLSLSNTSMQERNVKLSPPLIDVEVALDTAAKSYVAIITLHHENVPKHKTWKAEFNTEPGVMLVFTINGDPPLWELLHQHNNSNINSNNKYTSNNNNDSSSTSSTVINSSSSSSQSDITARRQRKAAVMRSSMVASLNSRNSRKGKDSPSIIYDSSAPYKWHGLGK